MRKVLALVAAGLLLLAPTVLGQDEGGPQNASDTGFLLEIGLEPAAADLQELDIQFLASSTCIPASKCCKVCNKGKACGNSCISRSYNCHKGRGCACDSSEVCG